MTYFNSVLVALFTLLGILQLAHYSMLQQLTQLHTDEIQHREQQALAAQQKVRDYFRTLPMDTTGTYRVEANVVRAANNLSVHDVTMVTQCTPSHLHHVVGMAERWNGPLSVAVFVQLRELSIIRRLMRKLQHCPAVLGQHTSVHLVYVEKQLDHLTVNNAGMLSAAGGGGDGDSHGAALATAAECADALKQMSTSKDANYALQVPYPNNLLRNVARDSSLTTFVMVVDVDMVPNPSLREDFLQFARRKELFQSHKYYDKDVYVIPVFEARTSLPSLPKSKTELITVIQDKTVRPFYITRCDKCHRHTDFQKWVSLAPSNEAGMTAAYDVAWKDAWEPFYIGRRTVPRYDERFKQYGFNRISNVCQLHMASYVFHVMDPGFLIHKGFKEKGQFHADKDAENSINRDLYTVFRRELRARYPEYTRECV